MCGVNITKLSLPLAVLAVAFASEVRAQTFPSVFPYSSTIEVYPEPSIYAPSSVVTRTARGTFMRPTYFTSINYPWLYGAHTYGLYEPGSWAGSGAALGQPFSSTPVGGTLGPPATPSRAHLVNAPITSLSMTELNMTPPTLPKLSALTARNTSLRTTDLGASAVVDIIVPSKATVWVDGQLLDQEGSTRRYISAMLLPRQQRIHEVKVRWTELGEPVILESAVAVQAGDAKTVNFRETSSTGTSTLRARP